MSAAVPDPACSARVRAAYAQTVQALARMQQKRDPYTCVHQRRVADLAAAIAVEMGLPSDCVEGVRQGATIHDIGKIYVPAEILARPGRLLAAEMELMREHVRAGWDIVKDVQFPWPVAQMILQHHERLDGSGYPEGLRGDAIVLEARILAVADVVEAMASFRPYRPALGIAVALSEVESKRGTHFDADAVAACLRLFRERRFHLAETEEP